MIQCENPVAPPPPLQVSKAKVWVEQAPWKRVAINGLSHEHGEAHNHHLLLLLAQIKPTANICSGIADKVPFCWHNYRTFHPNHCCCCCCCRVLHVRH